MQDVWSLKKLLFRGTENFAWNNFRNFEKHAEKNKNNKQKEWDVIKMNLEMQ